MNEDSEPVLPFPEDDETDDGRISILANFNEDVSPVFLSKIRNTIERRTAVSQFASLYCALSPLVAAEMSRMLAALFSSCLRRQEAKP